MGRPSRRLAQMRTLTVAFSTVHDGLGESLVRTNPATHERDSDVPMYADDPIRLGLDPRCALGVDLQLTALLPSQSHAAMVGGPVQPRVCDE